MGQLVHAPVEPRKHPAAYGSRRKSEQIARVCRKHRPVEGFNKARPPPRATRSHMKTPTSALLRQRLLSLWVTATLLACAGVHAAPVKVPDAQDWARLTPAEQAQRKAALKQQLQQATPQERKAFRQQLRQQIETLSPAERQALIDSTRQRWLQLSPQEKQRLADERREQVNAMTPEERRELLRQRREMLEKLSPEEREALREKLKAD